MNDFVTMREILFHLFAALALVPAFFVATSRNPVNAAINMLVTFVGLSGLLFMLETYFLGILQVLVYAGAIVVLFLFIIMLIDVEKSPHPKFLRFLASLVALGLMIAVSYSLIYSGGSGPFAVISTDSPGNLARNFGVELFTRYLFPFQVAGFMLLIAMVGVIVICRRLTEKEAEQ